MPAHKHPVIQVQCLSGHTYYAASDSELEAQCKEHSGLGYIDALILQFEECEYCLYDAIASARRTYQALCGDWGCMGDCGSRDSDKCQGTDDIVRYESLQSVAQKRNQVLIAA